MAAERKLTRQLVVRVDDATYTAIEADAELHGRTVAQSVRFKLRELRAVSPPSEPTGGESCSEANA